MIKSDVKNNFHNKKYKIIHNNGKNQKRILIKTSNNKRKSK